MQPAGLTSKQVLIKTRQGKVNTPPKKQLNSIGQIVARNTLTVFNLVNLILAIMILLVGSYKNMLFIIIAIANALIAVINEVRARNTVNKMRLLAEQRPTVIRDGKPHQILAEEIVEGDLLVLSIGDQVLVGAEIKEGTVEVNESFITGEQATVQKSSGDQLLSGSFIVSGTCKATATAVGADSYVAKLEQSAYSIKSDKSALFTIMNSIVKYVSFALIPIGALLLWARFRVPGTTSEIAVTSTVAALINMIPEGLILLTSSVLALATVRLSRQKVLVQDLYAIETLARVDCIALDKTGTLTTGNMVVKDLIPAKGTTKNTLETTLKFILSTSEADNATSTALKKKLLKDPKFTPREKVTEVIPFSSERKYSGVITNKHTYLMGAPEFITTEKPDFDNRYRVLAVVKREDASESKLIGYVLLEDELRKDAKSIVNYFVQNSVDIKIISGDNLKTVQNIASIAGVKNADQAVDLSTIKTPNYNKLVQDYTIFARVKPAEKKSLIQALKKQGKTVAMTGDGVNDILAMKEADCSIAIGEGSDAARRSAKFVLLGSDFSSVPRIIDEGRQSINNLERSTALFLAKTIYASILAVIFVFLSLDYPFSPIEMTLLNFACIGFPGVVLSLEKNTSRIKNRFTKNILEYSFPIGVTVSLCMLALSTVAHIQNFTRPELTTVSVFVTFVIDLLLIYWLSRPLNRLRTGLLVAVIGIMVLAFSVPPFRNFFEFTTLGQNSLITMLIITIGGIIIFELFRRLMSKTSSQIINDSQSKFVGKY